MNDSVGDDDLTFIAFGMFSDYILYDGNIKQINGMYNQ